MSLDDNYDPRIPALPPSEREPRVVSVSALTDAGIVDDRARDELRWIFDPNRREVASRGGTMDVRVTNLLKQVSAIFDDRKHRVPSEELRRLVERWRRIRKEAADIGLLNAGKQKGHEAAGACTALSRCANELEALVSSLSGTPAATITRLYGIKASVWKFANALESEPLADIARDVDRTIAELESAAMPAASPPDERREPPSLERWRDLYRALAWMVNDYIGVTDYADYTKKDARLGYAHEGYHNARRMMREHKPPVPERLQRFNDGTGCLTGGNQHSDRCVCQTKETGQFAGTPHKHYDEPPYACARCGCKAYDPAERGPQTEEPK